MSDDSRHQRSGKFRVTVGAALAAGALLAGCGSGSGLETDDPAGYAACQALAESISLHGDMASMESSLDAGRLALDATTPEIKAAAASLGDAPELAGFALPDEEAMTVACESHGVEIGERPQG